MLIQKDDIAIRPMRDDMQDYYLVSKWLSDEKVLEFYGGRNNHYPLERVLKKYQPRVKGDVPIIPCIFSYQSINIGYLQYYLLDDIPDVDWQRYRLESTAHTYDIDLLIGETNYWNQGIGTKVLSAATRYLFEQLKAHKIIIAALAWNTRAIRCYEKCGFVKIQFLPKDELHEGEYHDSWLMALEPMSQKISPPI